ncbi:MAG TPA: glycoside hydrolase family 78 protein [Ohtaekwangia sp.]|uniref:glycoside hydrolase family 78 protein n=1 Tax=Ohtaekwangia sp. TaxID=2066019 RepID=UPI002F91F052
MPRFILSLLFVLTLTVSYAQKLQLTELTTEYQRNPIGIDITTPRFSWKLSSPARDVMQTAYEVRVSNDDKSKSVVWQSGRVTSDQSVFIAYSGAPLKATQRYRWQARAWDNKGNAAPWSEVQFFEMGLLKPTDWTANWIEPAIPGDSVNSPSPMLRRTFDIKKSIASARLYITAHGLYESFINGKRVGNQYLTPGWTSYNKRLQYQTYDVTTLLRNGSNATGVLLGDGWYRGNLAWGGLKNIYGKTLGILYQLEITYTDGSKEVIASDDKWKASTGAIRRAGIYYGEAYDARLEKKGWAETGYSDADWQGVNILSGGKENILAAYGPPVRKHETFKPVKIFKTPKGQTVVDFGQNLVGWITLRVKGDAGDKVTVRHAEVLDKDKNVYLENLRAAEAEVVYTLKGGGEEVYEPHFSFFGFRYAWVEGFPGTLTADNISATALYSDMTPTGNFSCSNALVNQLQHNIQWGQKGNFVDVPTDCPQRDERLGWTGDAQVFCRTATYNMNVAPFFNKWLKDIAADQRSDGAVPFVIPNVLGDNASASTGWADVAVIIPWNIYQAFGDRRILENQYESMKAWVNFMESKSKNDLWNTGFHFGDWLFYRPFDDNDGRSAVTDKYLIAQCFWAHSTQLLLNAAQVLGKTEDIQHYTAQLKKIKEAFIKEYTTSSGRLVSGTQTAYVLALNFDMLPEELRAQAAQRLAQNVKDYGNHLTTGFLGTPYLCHVLTRFGYTDVAYDLLLQQEYPSWLYPVKMGATTIWERWDGMKPDSTFQTPGMNSFNHYAYGAIGDWMYRTVAGVQESAAGYKQSRIAPEPATGKLTQATAELQTMYGLIRSSWKIDNGIYTLDVQVPPNTTAEVVLPRAAQQRVTEQKAELTAAKFTSEKQGENLKLKLGSGVYHFEYNWQ